MEKQIVVCSFCGKNQIKAKKLIASPNGSSYICDECVQICSDILADTHSIKFDTNIKLMKPKEIKEVLDGYIVSQESAKEIISVAVYNHFKRLKYNQQNFNNKSKTELEKSNLLLIGPTGSGKTLLAKTLANMLNVPFASCDATSLTEAGYVGDDVESVLQKLLQNANFDAKRAERGIIYIDEIDKIARRSTNKSLPRDPSGEGVQQALLKIIEGTTASVPLTSNRKYPNSECIDICTNNILFICGGAFVGLSEIIEKKNVNFNLGFTAQKSKQSVANFDITPQDLIKYGIIPEFVGRLPVIAKLEKLSTTDLANILKVPKNNIVNQYKELFAMDGIELVFDESAIQEISSQAYDLNTGARALRTIVEKALHKISFESPSDNTICKVIITKDSIKNCKAFKIERIKKENQNTL